MRVWVSVGSGSVAVALLLLAPLAAGADQDAPETPAPGDPAWWLGLLVVVAQAILLAVPATPPGRRLALVALGAPAGMLAGLGAAVAVTFVAVVVATFLAARSLAVRRLWPALALAATLVAVGQLGAELDIGSTPGVAVAAGVVQGLGVVGITSLVGAFLRAQREARDARADQLRALQQEREALVEAAVARERTAMARELHDIAAHHLSGIAVTTGAIGRQIDTDPDGAKQAVRAVREHSRELLGDLRKLVVLLREEPAARSDTGSGPESLDGVRALVETARRAGTEVSLTVRDHPDGRPASALVGPLAQLSAYRTVQEALANAVRHAPGSPCEVVVDAGAAGTVRVTVRNAPPTGTPRPAATDRGGFGLVGMRERAELTGARLDVGPEPDGGWRVSLRLPTLEQSPRPEAR